LIEAARAVMGGIDLDPASCVEAQACVKAREFTTKGFDSLRPEVAWVGRVWLNPPYSMPAIREFITKLIDEYEVGNVTEAIIITNNSSDTSWFHDLLSRYPACFTRGRVQFWRADHTTFGARQGQTLFYLGDNSTAFRDVFGELGQVVIKA
jgi:ParB family chromosome partitioning protein